MRLGREETSETSLVCQWERMAFLTILDHWPLVGAMERMVVGWGRPYRDRSSLTWANHEALEGKVGSARTLQAMEARICWGRSLAIIPNKPSWRL